MKMQRKRTVLAVDDDEMNLMILIKNIKDAGYEPKPFSSGDAAWEYLEKNPGTVDIALLDKMMPGMSGIELLNHIKSSPSLRHIPVIMQTGDAGVKQMCEGLDGGALYYLTKPFHPEILVSILHVADNECELREEMLAQMTSSHGTLVRMMEKAEFSVRTHAEARLLTAAISQVSPRSDFVARGVMELLYNAIEHGNLEIGYETKSAWLQAGRWEEELAKRACDPRYISRVVHVRMEKMFSSLDLYIRDEGRGFNWKTLGSGESLSKTPNAYNGRGIAIAQAVLDEVRYEGTGSEVHCSFVLPGQHSVSADMFFDKRSPGWQSEGEGFRQS